MISKNIYNPYARHFSPFVAPLFLETYGLVDEITRGKLEELVQTWRQGSPTKQELFGVVAQVAIERGIWGDGSSNVRSVHLPHSRRPQYILQPVPSGSTSGHISKAQVLSELEFTLSQTQRAVQANPYDTVSQGHVNVLYQVRQVSYLFPFPHPHHHHLHQLRGVVEAGVSQAELHQILTQLRNLVRSSAPPPPPQPPLVPPPAAAWPAQYPPPASFPPPVAPQPHSQPAGFVKVEHPPPIASSSTQLPISDLLSSLLKAGVVLASPTPVGAGATTKEEELSQLMEREARKVYRNAILSQPIRLTTSEITRYVSIPCFHFHF
jgi:pre-mRNA cleavage complex 2 protein Pcf11